MRGIWLIACLSAAFSPALQAKESVSDFRNPAPVDRSAQGDAKSSIVNGPVPCAANQTLTRIPGGTPACTTKPAPLEKNRDSPGSRTHPAPLPRNAPPEAAPAQERQIGLGEDAAPRAPAPGAPQAPNTGMGGAGSEPGRTAEGFFFQPSEEEDGLGPCQELYAECRSYFSFVCVRARAANAAEDEKTVQRLLGTLAKIKASCLREAHYYDCVDPGATVRDLGAECPLQ